MRSPNSNRDWLVCPRIALIGVTVSGGTLTAAVALIDRRLPDTDYRLVDETGIVYIARLPKEAIDLPSRSRFWNLSLSARRVD